MKSQKENLEQLPAALPWVVGIAAVVLVVFYVGAFHRLPFTEDPSAWGAFGDYAGGLLNPLVSTFTLMVAVKVWRQQKIEMEETKKALEEQAKTAEQQRQEQRFFDLLNVLSRTEDSIFYTDLNGNIRGKTAIANYVSDLGIEFSQTYRNGLGQEVGGVKITLPLIKHLWQSKPSKMYLTPYLRLIYRVLADAEALLGDQNYRYIKLLRAQLSSGELTVIGLAIWLDDDWAKLRQLVCKYGLLKHLPHQGLRQELASALPINIFGRSAQNQAAGFAVTAPATPTGTVG